jgi:hypothetical protein
MEHEGLHLSRFVLPFHFQHARVDIDVLVFFNVVLEARPRARLDLDDLEGVSVGMGDPKLSAPGFFDDFNRGMVIHHIAFGYR